MKINVQFSENNVYSFMRNIGYAPLGESYVRRLGKGDYPRFHVYLEQTDNKLTINLHLDQKRPVYEGSPAHGGEYEGELVEKEVERIKQFAGR